MRRITSEFRSLMASPSELSAIAQRICCAQPLAQRLKQSYRPYICPFEHLLSHIPEGARALDVGCGGGLFLGLAAELGRLERGTGFDVSPLAIQAANLIRVRTPLTFEHVAPGADWPKGKFNLVTMIDVMHHIPRDERAVVFLRIRERLEPDGILLYKDINSNDRARSMV
jgi:2-polyprenyl-3-methyl-5-hydroxy-6-metoxy-1,4-benzoquinol methylase